MAVSSKVTLACIPDLFSSPTRIATTGAEIDVVLDTQYTETGSLTTDNLKDDDFDVTWRPPSKAAYHNSLSFNLGASLDIEAVALVMPNALVGAKWRFMLAPNIDYRSWTEELPSSIMTSTNLTGTISQLSDSPFSPNTSWLTATSAGSTTSVRVDFASPSLGTGGTELLNATDGGLHTQMIAVRVRRTGTGGVPWITGSLRESGSHLDYLTLVYSSEWPDNGQSDPLYITETGTTGSLLIFAFDPSVLADTTGANVEIHLDGIAVGGESVEFNSIGWLAPANGTPSGVTYDSGLMDFYDDNATFQARMSSPLNRNPQGINWTGTHILPATETERYGTIEIYQPIGPLLYGGLVDSVCGNYDDIPRIFLGETFVPSSGMARGWKRGLKDASSTTRNRLGTSRDKFTYMKRTLSVPFRFLRNPEAMQDFIHWVAMNIGTTRPVVVVTEPTNTEGVQSIGNGAYRITNLGELTNASPGRSHLTLEFEEW